MSEQLKNTTSPGVPPKDSTTKEESKEATASESGDATTSSNSPIDLVLTSEQRRGVYECDYCHSDISQFPRIRCAVCPDFDLCLDCFATTDHSAAIARLKAAAASSESSSVEGISAVSTAAINHQDSHGYRVCDSLRFPLFPTAKNLQSAASKTASNQSTDEKLSETGESDRGQLRDDEDGTSDGGKSEAPADVSKESEGAKSTDGGPAGSDEKGRSTDESMKTDPEDAKPKAGSALSSQDDEGDYFVLSDDPRTVWTIEEDLRLIEGIRSHGLGNWIEISEAVSGQGSIGKTPKRCMERYFDDFLGRYGHILPPVLLQAEETSDTDADKPGADASKPDEGETIRASKRRAVLLRSPSTVSSGSTYKRKFKAAPTASAAGYENVWPDPYLPPVEGVQTGEDVCREQAYKAEQSFLKLISTLEKPEDVAKTRGEWEGSRLGKPGGPTVLPLRPEDVAKLPGSELSGFMVRRGEFDVEWQNDAEQAIADMEFLPNEPPQDKELKLKVLAIYNAKLDEREKRKKFILSRKLYDYRKSQDSEQKLTLDERDLMYRLRLFERYHTPEEHKVFLADLLKAKRLRKEIAKLQMYRRLGIRTLAEAEKYELDKSRRAFHKAAQYQKETEKSKASENPASGQMDTSSRSDETASSSLWKQYRTTDRKVRRSINRGDVADPPMDASTHSSQNAEEANGTSEKQELKIKSVSEASVGDPMDIDHSNDVKREEEPAAGEGAGEPNPNETDDDLSKMPGYDLLSRREVDLCQKLKLTPRQYGDVKTAIIHESFTHGLFDRESRSSSRRTLVQIDATRRDDIIDFVVRAGWVSTKFGSSMRETLSTSMETEGEGDSAQPAANP